MNKELAGKTIIIEFQTGVDKNGNPTYKRKSIKNINHDVTDEQIYNVSMTIANLFKDTVSNILIDEDYILTVS